MSISEWESLSPDEFNHVCEAFFSKEDRHSKESWLQTRKLAMFVMRAYHDDIDEKKYFPLWFDKEEEQTSTPAPKPTRERFEHLSKLYGDEET